MPAEARSCATAQFKPQDACLPVDELQLVFRQSLKAFCVESTFADQLSEQ